MEGTIKDMPQHLGTYPILCSSNHGTPLYEDGISQQAFGTSEVGRLMVDMQNVADRVAAEAVSRNELAITRQAVETYAEGLARNEHSEREKRLGQVVHMLSESFASSLEKKADWQRLKKTMVIQSNHNFRAYTDMVMKEVEAKVISTLHAAGMTSLASLSPSKGDLDDFRFQLHSAQVTCGDAKQAAKEATDKANEVLAAKDVLQSTLERYLEEKMCQLEKDITHKMRKAAAEVLDQRIAAILQPFKRQLFDAESQIKILQVNLSHQQTTSDRRFDILERQMEERARQLASFEVKSKTIVRSVQEVKAQSADCKKAIDDVQSKYKGLEERMNKIERDYADCQLKVQGIEKRVNLSESKVEQDKDGLMSVIEKFQGQAGNMEREMLRIKDAMTQNVNPLEFKDTVHRISILEVQANRISEHEAILSNDIQRFAKVLDDVNAVQADAHEMLRSKLNTMEANLNDKIEGIKLKLEGSSRHVVNNSPHYGVPRVSIRQKVEYNPEKQETIGPNTEDLPALKEEVLYLLLGKQKQSREPDEVLGTKEEGSVILSSSSSPLGKAISTLNHILEWMLSRDEVIKRLQYFSNNAHVVHSLSQTNSLAVATVSPSLGASLQQQDLLQKVDFISPRNPKQSEQQGVACMVELERVQARWMEQFEPLRKSVAWLEENSESQVKELKSLIREESKGLGADLRATRELYRSDLENTKQFLLTQTGKDMKGILDKVEESRAASFLGGSAESSAQGQGQRRKYSLDEAGEDLLVKLKVAVDLVQLKGERTQKMLDEALGDIHKDLQREIREAQWGYELSIRTWLQRQIKSIKDTVLTKEECMALNRLISRHERRLDGFDENLTYVEPNLKNLIQETKHTKERLMSCERAVQDLLVARSSLEKELKQERMEKCKSLITKGNVAYLNELAGYLIPPAEPARGRGRVTETSATSFLLSSLSRDNTGGVTSAANKPANKAQNRTRQYIIPVNLDEASGYPSLGSLHRNK